ncbi:4Fe-4S dicluster domain-containing protein [Maribellus comscasis]|uniref:4Fe-4S dicluster domain-containing protein n=1 Tax=Maribellus comscasis TaxID=2681766 RepID=A0A6I6JQB8_9BACT|nr:4Fe-4S binding protein [Maribellus comscasis]QGY43220.1 4Fe-4S dicluster domain-containing protein [Maribellus comscasis]
MKLTKSKYIRRISTAVAVLLALPLQLGFFTGFYMWLSPFVMLNSLFLLKSMVWLNILGWGILLVSFFRNRWFCRYMCPVGLGCDSFSKWGKHSRTFVKKVPRLGRWLALLSLAAALTGIPLFTLLDPLSVFNGFFAAFASDISLAIIASFIGLPVLLVIHLFLPGIWCGKLCPLGGLFDELTTWRKWIIKKFLIKKNISTEQNVGRRMFIASGTGLLAGVFIPPLLHAERKQFFRPPASLRGNLFNTLCVRCGSCIKACPSNIIIHHSGKKNITAWMTPEVSFENKGYCLEDCNLCGTVCPTGSISPFTLNAKKKLFIGSINIRLENCLLSDFKECDRCKSVCSYNAIQIVAAQNLMMKPLADLNKCVGCGACSAVCPTETISMIPLEKTTSSEEIPPKHL